jgi:type VI secretion system protein ImpA
LRLAVILTRALLKLEGLTGAAQGFALIHALLRTQWVTVHPQPDADDNDDPTFRINSLLSLAAADGLLKLLREATVVDSKVLGRFSLRDIRISQGKLAVPAGREPLQPAQLEAAFLGADLEALKRTETGVTGALSEVAAIDQLLVEKVGERAPDFKPLVVDLTEIKQILNEKIGAREGKGAAEPASGRAAPSAARSPDRAVALSGEIASREDVVRMLESICDYYRRHEPSSPLPLLLQRAKRLVALDFMAIVRDLTPAGVAEAELLAGVVKEGE